MRANRRRAGFTLVEATIVVALFSIVIGVAVVSAKKGQDAFRRNVHESAVQARTSRALNNIARRLQGARGSALLPSPFPETSEWVEYERANGFAASEIVWSETFRVRLEYEPAELDNGVDDDGDGLVDECRVVVVEDLWGAEPRTVTLANNVAEFLEGEVPDGDDDNANGLTDERGLCFERRGAELIVRITTQGIDPEGRLTERTLATSVALRN